MKEPIIESLFPTPLYKTDINRLFTNDELNFVQSQKNFVNKNDGNVSSSDNYILNRKELKNIKKFLDDCCKDYLEKIICPKENIQLYITQSWLNYTEEHQFHHMHEHPNSVISGVLYFNSDEKNDKIKFTRLNRYQQIVPLIKTFNIWNSHTWWFPVKSGELILFPSSTTHQVDVKQGKNTRISLAFNTFYKGKLGKNNELTELIL